MELVLFILGFVIGVLVCYTVSNIKELRRIKNKNNLFILWKRINSNRDCRQSRCFKSIHNQNYKTG